VGGAQDLGESQESAAVLVIIVMKVPTCARAEMRGPTVEKMRVFIALGGDLAEIKATPKTESPDVRDKGSHLE
jgi:hypothetical protein